MNYDKLTVERFKERLEAGEYDGLTGARRAIGKAKWSDKDRNAARALADAHFGADGAKPAKKTAAKKPAAPKKAASAAPKKVAAAKPAPAPKKAAAKKAARTAAPQAPRVAHTTTESIPSSPFRAPAPAPAAAPFHLEEATRSNSAALVIQAMRGTGPLSALESRTYAVAQEEYWASARQSARHAVDVAQHGVPVPQPLDQPAVEHVTAPTGAAPRIPALEPQNGVGELIPMTPEQQAQFDRLQKGSAAIPAILGQGGTGTPTS